jgi:hypothetical protein
MMFVSRAAARRRLHIQRCITWMRNEIDKTLADFLAYGMGAVFVGPVLEGEGLTVEKLRRAKASLCLRHVPVGELYDF